MVMSGSLLVCILAWRRYFAQAVAHSSSPTTLRTEWQTVFCVAAGVHVVGAAFFVVFADAKVQPWASREGRQRSTASRS